MKRCLSMLKTGIRQFLSTQRYDTLTELLDVTRRQEIEMDIHMREQQHAPIQSLPAAKQFNPADS